MGEYAKTYPVVGQDYKVHVSSYHNSYRLFPLNCNLNLTYNRLHKSDQLSGGVLSTKEQLSMKRKESVKLKESADNAKPIPMGHQLTTCNRQFRARIGLVSHQRTHQHI